MWAVWRVSREPALKGHHLYGGTGCVHVSTHTPRIDTCVYTPLGAHIRLGVGGRRKDLGLWALVGALWSLEQGPSCPMAPVLLTAAALEPACHSSLCAADIYVHLCEKQLPTSVRSPRPVCSSFSSPVSPRPVLQTRMPQSARCLLRSPCCRGGGRVPPPGHSAGPRAPQAKIRACGLCLPLGGLGNERAP